MNLPDAFYEVAFWLMVGACVIFTVAGLYLVVIDALSRREEQEGGQD